jgi:hypothetical protein
MMEMMGEMAVGLEVVGWHRWCNLWYLKGSRYFNPSS